MKSKIIKGKFGTKSHMLEVLGLCYYYMNGVMYNSKTKKIDNVNLTNKCKKELEETISKYWFDRMNKKI